MATYQWEQLSPIEVVALKGYGGEQGIYVRASILRALNGDGSAAIYLTQLIYWSQSEAAIKNDGWFYLTTAQVTKTLGLSRYRQERVRGDLSKAGILETKLAGTKAKNYYRLRLDIILDLLAEAYTLDDTFGGETPNQDGGDAPNLDGGETPNLVGGKSPNIVNTPVKIKSNNISSPSASGKRSAEPLNVLADEFEKYVSDIQAHYPLNWQGLPVTEWQARKALRKLGDIRKNATEEDRLQAQNRVRELVRAIKNIEKAVNIGDLESRFVPGFPKFVGTDGISYGKEPAYKAWALRVFAEKKPRLVV